MRVFNEDKTAELTEYDLENGYLIDDRLFVKHHNKTDEVKEKFHYEVIAEYENGGKDLKKIIDIPYQPAKDAWDEYEDIKVYHPYSEAELKNIASEQPATIAGFMEESQNKLVQVQADIAYICALLDIDI